ncbi:hypothetical protein PT974_05726 [Cladobotryum mycophilum]|uniref:Uncharacterized protein n=1 Tax=Cladobotryum mycophilum TaxID=491253 RepID=A0ABR0SJL5_9HYPO
MSTGDIDRLGQGEYGNNRSLEDRTQTHTKGDLEDDGSGPRGFRLQVAVETVSKNKEVKVDATQSVTAIVIIIIMATKQCALC